MKIQLPLENWTDLLPLVPRRQLVEIIKQIGDRQFSSILQFFLTKEGQITLGHLRIVAPRENAPNGGGPIVEVPNEMPPFHLPVLETNLPEGPMPTNVKDFTLIQLSYFDMSVANFLRHFQQEQQQPGNSLLDNVNLWFSSALSSHDDNTIMPILAQLMPMIGNINSMSIRHLHHMELGCVGVGPNNAASQLLTTMLTNVRILEIHYDMEMCTFPWCDWLYTPRNDGKPRALRLHDSFPDFGTKNLIEQIEKDFSKATCPVSFFVFVRAVDRGNVQWQDICLDNGQTKERLVVKTLDPPPRDPFHFRFFGPKKFVLISRYPVGANREWIEANEQEIMKWKFDQQNRRIHFERSLRNGLKSFPFPDQFYYIKTQSGLQDEQFRYLCVLDKQHSSAGDRPPSKFKFIKNSDGRVSISTMAGYLQINMESSRLCLAGVNSCSTEKFMLIFGQQSQQPGFVVDIRSLANDCFLSVDHQLNRILANSRTPPANKFLIIPVPDGQ